MFDGQLRFISCVLLEALCFFGNLYAARASDHVEIDASEPYTAPLPSSYTPGTAKARDGHLLGLNERYLTMDGKPWLPVMGEFHYTRVPEAQWEEEILKMKAAGVQIIADYVIWIHHEEVEGSFDWSGDRDLRHFAELCARHGMYLYIRIGPWAHGEARNGGFPDWLLTKGPTRTTDPVYMSYVARYYGAIGQQLHGLLWKDGGPVIGVQLENEYSDTRKGGGEEYILALKQLAIDSGLDVPLYSVTGWDRAVVPHGAVLPVFGGYPDAPWDADLGSLPPGEVYAFRFGDRVTGNMGMMGGKPAAGAAGNRHADTPFLTAEMGGGIQDTYHRRPVLSTDDVVAMFPVMLGSGVNLYGTYMFQGGENPDGKLTTLQESQATGYPTDVPVKSYDFQAPLSQFGEERESFRKLKVIDYFLNDFGAELATMVPRPPAILPKNPADLSVPRVSARTRGESGFIFVNNYIRGTDAPVRSGMQIDIKLPSGLVQLPAHPIDVPSGAYFIWPFNLDMNGVLLRYSTAQLFTKLITGKQQTYFFFCIPGVRCEFAFVERPGVEVKAASGDLTHEDGVTYIRNVQPGDGSAISLRRKDGAATRIVVMTQADAENAWKVSIADEDYLLITKQQFFASRQTITLRSDGEPAFDFKIFPANKTPLHSSAPLQMSVESDGSTRFTAVVPAVHVALEQEKIHDSRQTPPVKLGPLFSWRPRGVAQAPAESTFADAAQWRLKLGKEPLHGLRDIFLRVEYVGDVARLSSQSHLLDDDFYNGNPWYIGMKRYISRGQTGDLQLSILPLRSDSPIFLEKSARDGVPPLGQIDQLRSITAIPQYELVLQLSR